jgi:hypothetical protein
MAKEKQYVFSARTTEEGLRRLNELRKERGIGWDELVVDAICAHYGLDRGTMAIPKPVKAEKPNRPETEAGRTKKTTAKEKANAKT